MIIEYVCICHIYVYIYIYTFLPYKNIYVDIVTNIFLLDTMQKKISGRGKLPKFEMIYDRKNKYLLSVTISIEHNNDMWSEEEITNRFLNDLTHCKIFITNYNKEPWEDPSMGVFERITLQRKSEYVKGVKVDFTKPMEIADKSLEMNNIEMKKTNVQLIESVSPNSKTNPAIAYTVNNGGPSQEEEEMYQRILKEREDAELEKQKRQEKSDRAKKKRKKRKKKKKNDDETTTEQGGGEEEA